MTLLKKNKFKTEHLDYISTILKTSIQALIPSDHPIGGEINILASNAVYDHKIEYEFIEIDVPDSQDVIWTKKIKKGIIRKIHSDLHTLVLNYFKIDRFQKPHSSLEFFLKFEKELGLNSFTPADLQKNLSVLMTAKGKFQLLRNIKSRFYYVKNYTKPPDKAD